VTRRQGIEPSRLRRRDLLGEAISGLAQRPGRTALTLLGTVLGVGAFVTILGLTTTISGQVAKDFTVLSATQVMVNDVGDPRLREVSRSLDDFPPDADTIIDKLNGTVHAGTTWPIPSDGPPGVSATQTGGDAHQIEVDAASPGYLQALEPTMQSGVVFNSFHDDRQLRVAVLGAAAAGQLHITHLATQPAVFINGIGFTVVGILADVGRDPDALLKVLIPDHTAMAYFGPPAVDRPPTMLIETRLGAAPLIARQASIALRPDQPFVLQAIPPPDPHQLQSSVAGNLNSLFLILAGITLLIGAASIANTTLVAVMERIGEIGLRRSLGARPGHIAGQFLVESAALGTLGGLLGTATGVTATLTIALANQWTAVLDPLTTVPAPLIGTLTGLAAGAYPALRAARIEPIESLRR
jgi:putative ABC transport system permease protein